MIFHQTETGCNFRMAKTPRGPTFTFRVENYTTSGDLQTTQRKSRSLGMEFMTSPLVVLNNFNNSSSSSSSSGSGITDSDSAMRMKLMTSMFQNVFPSINVKTMNLKDARRVALFNWNQETEMVEFRHYLISVKPVGVSKSVKKIVSTSCKQIPDLSAFEDVADFIKS